MVKIQNPKLSLESMPLPKTLNLSVYVNTLKIITIFINTIVFSLYLCFTSYAVSLTQ